jgi:solute carrier family 35 protein E1
MTASSARDPSPQSFKFPAFQPDLLPMPEEEYGQTSSRTPSPSHAAQTNGSATPADRWQPRKEARFGYMNGTAPAPATRHGRQKSLSEAVRTIRTRKASVSQNVHEIADALKAPLSPRLIVGAARSERRRRTANAGRCSAACGT